MKRWIWAGAFLLVGLYLGALGAYVYLKRQILSRAEKFLGRPLTYERYYFNPLRGVVMEGAAADGVFSAGRLVVSYDLGALLRRRSLARVEAQDAYLCLDSLPKGQGGGGGGGGGRLEVGSLDLRGVRVVVAGREFSANRVIGSVEIDGPRLWLEAKLWGAATPWLSADSVFGTLLRRGDTLIFSGRVWAPEGQGSLMGMVNFGTGVLHLASDSLIWLGYEAQAAEMDLFWNWGELRVRARRLSRGELTLARVGALLQLGDTLRLVWARARYGGAALRGEGWWKPGGDFSLTVEARSPVRWGDFGARGEVVLWGRWPGRLNLRANLEDVEARGLSVGRVVAGVWTEDMRVFSVESVRVSGPLGSLRAQGKVSRNSADLSLAGQGLKLAAFGDGFGGELELRGTLGWRRGRWPSYRGLARGQGLRWSGGRVARVEFRGVLSPDNVDLSVGAEGLALGGAEVSEARLEARGELGQGALKLSLRSREGSFAAWGWYRLNDTLRALYLDSADLSLRGVEARMHGVGVQAWRGELDLSLAYASLMGGILSGGGKLVGDSLELYISLAGLSLQELARATAIQDSLMGSLDALVKLEGSLRKPRLAYGRLTLRRFRWRGYSLDTAFVSLRANQRYLVIERAEARSGEDSLVLEATLPIAWRLRPPSFSLDSSAPVAGRLVFGGAWDPLFWPFERAVILEGRKLSGVLTLAGTLRHPWWSGRIRLEADEGVLVATGSVLSRVRGEAELRGDTGVLSLAGRVEEGSFSASGFVILAPPFAWNLRVSFSGVNVYPSPYIEAVASGEIAILGSLERPKATGSITLDELVANVPLAKGGSSGGAEKPNPWEMEITVRADRNLYFSNELVDMEFGADLLVAKKPNQPVTLAGRLPVLGGEVYFLDRVFQIQEGGYLSFSGESRLDPEVSLTAITYLSAPDTSAGQLRVTLTLTGRLSAPEIGISSDPPMPPGDLIALLTLGDTSAGGMEARAFNLAEGLLSRELREKLMLKELELHTGLGGQSGLAVGFFIGKNVYIRYSREVGSAEKDEVIIKYYIKPNIAVYGETDESGQSVGFEYRIRF